MSGRDHGKKVEEEGEGWESTLLKVAGAAAAAATVVGGLYALFKQPEPVPEAPHQVFGAQTVQRQRLQNKEVWTKPMTGWLKLNVDGSLLPQSAGCGGVLRDSSGKWVSGFAQKLAQPSGHHPDETEKEAICKGLQWARGRRVRKVVVESDNMGVVNLVKSGIAFDPLICKIREFLSCGDWEATLNWIPGDANRVADKLADIARGLPSFHLEEFNSAPDTCRFALMADSQ